MAQLFHWPVPCTICEDPVEYHCHTCGDALCSKCRDNHQKSNATKNHDVVPYSQRTEQSKPSLQCGEHADQQCGVWCQTCNRAVCGDCVISPKHRGHHFLKFDEKIEEKRKDVQKQFDRYSKMLSNWQTSLKEAERIKEKSEKDIKQLDKEIVDQADELCKQVRRVEKERRKQLQQMTDISIRVLQDHQKTLADGIIRLKEKVKETEDTLRSTDSSTILQYSLVGENIPGKKPPIHGTSPVPVFSPGSLNIQVLREMLGSLSDQRVESIKPMPIEEKVKSLSTNPSVESVINIKESGYNPVIACVGSGQAWVKTTQKSLQLMDRTGKVERTVNIDFSMYDIAVTPQGNILLPDYHKKRIRSLSMEGKIKTIFHTKWKPDGICCLPTGEIEVAFRDDKRVVQYSSDGKAMKELGGSLFQYPWYVAYSKVNKQLVVSEKSIANTWDAPGRVRILHMDGQLQYACMYTGSDTSNLAPMGVCVDPAGHVLITDLSSQRVHILDKGGKFIRYLLPREKRLTEPVTIDVDNDGYAWIGERSTGRVIVVKYI